MTGSNQLCKLYTTSRLLLHPKQEKQHESNTSIQPQNMLWIRFKNFQIEHQNRNFLSSRIFKFTFIMELLPIMSLSKHKSHNYCYCTLGALVKPGCTKHSAQLRIQYAVLLYFLNFVQIRLLWDKMPLIKKAKAKAKTTVYLFRLLSMELLLPVLRQVKGIVRTTTCTRFHQTKYGLNNRNTACYADNIHMQLNLFFHLHVGCGCLLDKN